jgi:hypothetical protein
MMAELEKATTGLRDKEDEFKILTAEKEAGDAAAAPVIATLQAELDHVTDEWETLQADILGQKH